MRRLLSTFQGFFCDINGHIPENGAGVIYEKSCFCYKPQAVVINRELSWLQFNKRVLYEGMNPRNPLLERIRFLDICSSNLDEFFMKRVGEIQYQVKANVLSTDPSERAPLEKLRDIRAEVTSQLRERSHYFSECVKGELLSHGIALVGWDDLAPPEMEHLSTFFRTSIFPVLTPLSVDSGHPFPFISNLSTSIAVLMRAGARDEEETFARIKIPSIFPTWIQIGESTRFISLYEIIVHNLSQLFPGMEILEVTFFRVTRDADVEVDEEEADDLLALVTEEIRERRFAQVVRLEHGPNPSQKILRILSEELAITPEDIYELPLNLEFYSLGALAELNIPKLKFTPAPPLVPLAFSDKEANIFDVIRQNDVLVHHPYESFSESVERFLRTAANDPKVIAIKMTLYRTGEDSPFIPLLIRAAESGKQVAVLVELKARLDEERNILVAQALEKAGVHVVYGLMGLKTHSKLALVVRNEASGVRCYAHIGTGNYHARTARTYTDLGLFTSKEEFTTDVVHLFHHLTGRSLHWNFKKLLVAPIDMRDSFLRMIQREKDQVASGKPGRIIAKVNNLEDSQVIQALYDASNAGVQIDLIVRSISCIRPGVPGLSENIRVFSILGRFLEHSRLFYFQNGAATPEGGEFFLGSADWMYRNLSSRVEAAVPVEEPALRVRCWEILQLMLSPRCQGWEMRSDGSYERKLIDGNEPTLHAQEALYILTQNQDRPSIADRPTDWKEAPRLDLENILSKTQPEVRG